MHCTRCGAQGFLKGERSTRCTYLFASLCAQLPFCQHKFPTVHSCIWIIQVKLKELCSKVSWYKRLFLKHSLKQTCKPDSSNFGFLCFSTAVQNLYFGSLRSPQRALTTKTKVESGTCESTSETFVSSSNSRCLVRRSTGVPHFLQNTPPLAPYHRPMSRVLKGSLGRGAFSYERGTPVWYASRSMSSLAGVSRS